jgi:hypothetical protein
MPDVIPRDTAEGRHLYQQTEYEGQNVGGVESMVANLPHSIIPILKIQILILARQILNIILKICPHCYIDSTSKIMLNLNLGFHF